MIIINYQWRTIDSRKKQRDGIYPANDKFFARTLCVFACTLQNILCGLCRVTA